MKKISLRILSAILILMLTLSMLSITAAAEADIDPCAVCTHPNMMVTLGREYSSNGSSGHTAMNMQYFRCPDCGATSKKVDSTFIQAHTFQPTTEAHKIVCIWCGYTEYR